MTVGIRSGLVVTTRSYVERGVDGTEGDGRHRVGGGKISQLVDSEGNRRGHRRVLRLWLEVWDGSGSGDSGTREWRRGPDRDVGVEGGRPVSSEESHDGCVVRTGNVDDQRSDTIPDLIQGGLRIQLRD